MAQTKLIILCLASLLAASCCRQQPAADGQYVMTWTKVKMAGERTGVTAVAGDNVAKALGTLDESGVYVSPNGRKFNCGSTPAVAMALLDAQPSLAYLKEVIGHSPREMGKKRKPLQGPLANWAVDAIMQGVEAVTGQKVDVGLVNYGGIRKDMPEGDVLIDDIVSMFPFKNYLTWVQLKGSDLRALFESMAKGKLQAVGGVKLVVKGHELESIEVGGKPLDDKALYGLATIDFLLDGGDGVKAARNAKQLIISEVKVNEWLVPYVRSLTEAGKEVEAFEDDRVTYIDEEGK